MDEELRRRGNKGSSKRKTKSLDFIGSSKIIEKTSLFNILER
ncbi:MAG: hypothetical protein WC535_06620 [Candidatus Cloacimonas sp.]|nr:hypothetical protein [Candidatus Cloacimonadota bacterium]